MKSICLTACLSVLILTGCSTGPQRAGAGRTIVQNVGADDLLKLRAGPGLGYEVVLGLPDGTALIRRNCVTELGQRWCRVVLADAPNVRGYVSSDYLSGG